MGDKEQRRSASRGDGSGKDDGDDEDDESHAVEVECGVVGCARAVALPAFMLQ
jgi:hypothetical protein